MFGIFNDCFPPVMDGVSVATRNYAYWLHQKGEQVCVVTPSADEYEDREPFPVLRYCSIPLIFRNPYRMGLPQFDRHIRKSLNELPFSLVHAHCPFSSGKLALQQARMRHIPMVATFHSKYRADFERFMPIKAVVDYLIRDVVDFYNQADEVWIPQASVEETLREYGYRGKIEVVDNGNDFAGTFSEEERKQVRLQLGLKADEPLLLFVGQHIYEKNLDFLLRSVALLKDMPFRMFFIGTGYAASALQELARHLGLENRVSFLGRIIEREQLRRYYLAADLFLFPSRYDNAPLVVREAAALHTPSLMLEGSTASAVIRNGENGFLTTENTEEYARRIRSILQDPDLLARVAQGASDSLARSWEDIAGEVADRYRNLMNRFSRK